MEPREYGEVHSYPLVGNRYQLAGKQQLFIRNLETGWADSCSSELCPSESDMSQPSAWQQREMATACSWVLPGHSQ